MIYFIILLLVLVIFITLNFTKKEEFVTYSIDCHDKLTYNQKYFILWKNGNIQKLFRNYRDYLKFYNNTKKTYNKECSPLIVSIDKNNKGSILDLNDIEPKYFNLE